MNIIPTVVSGQSHASLIEQLRSSANRESLGKAVACAEYINRLQTGINEARMNMQEDRVDALRASMFQSWRPLSRKLQKLQTLVRSIEEYRWQQSLLRVVDAPSEGEIVLGNIKNILAEILDVIEKEHSKTLREDAIVNYFLVDENV